MIDLRTVLRLDAAASGGLGVLLIVLFGPAEGHLGLPVVVSLTVGVLLLVWTAFVGWVSTHLGRTWVKEVVGLNVLYVVLSVTFALGGWVSLTGLGIAVVLAQAAAVLLLTLVQVACLRAEVRSPVAA